MSLRPLIDIAAENERVHALAGRVRTAADGGEAVTVRASTMLRPLLLAALLEDDRGLAGRPALLEDDRGLADRPARLSGADDRSARNLPPDCAPYLAPRRVGSSPPRGPA